MMPQAGCGAVNCAPLAPGVGSVGIPRKPVMFRSRLDLCGLVTLFGATALALTADPVFAGEPASLAGITAAHNAARARVGVAPLAWDDGLAASAQAWANRCIDVAAPPGLIDHNPNRSAGFAFYVGENIFASSGTPTGQQAVKSWVEEAANYDYRANICKGMCGHYTQVVWSKSVRLGCGISRCAKLRFRNSIVCDYGPGGNNGGRPY